MLVTSIFSFFPTMFSTLTQSKFQFLVAFILSSANAFYLDKSKILSFGKGFIRIQVTISFSSVFWILPVQSWCFTVLHCPASGTSFYITRFTIEIDHDDIDINCISYYRRAGSNFCGHSLCDKFHFVFAVPKRPQVCIAHRKSADIDDRNYENLDTKFTSSYTCANRYF